MSAGDFGRGYGCVPRVSLYTHVCEAFFGWSDDGRVRAHGLGCAGDLDPEETREAALRQEWERAKERLTLKHRNTSRWAQRILKKGLQLNQVDPFC